MFAFSVLKLFAPSITDISNRPIDSQFDVAYAPKVSDPPAPLLRTSVWGLGSLRNRGPVIPSTIWHASCQTKLQIKQTDVALNS